MMKQKSTVKQRIISGILAVMMIAGIFGTWPIAIFAEGPVAQNAANVWDGSVANGFGGGSGTQADPYLIYTGAELAYLASKTNGGTTYSGKYFKLMNDIDLNNINWTPIGRIESTPFSGTFDGNFFKIKNAQIAVNVSGSSLVGVGLFGTLQNANLKNLGIEAYSYNISGGRSGGLVGVLFSSTVSNCFATGELTSTFLHLSGGESSGGLIGDIRGNSSVSNCYAACNLTTSSADSEFVSIGGLVGFICSDGTKNITNCYANSTIVSPDANSNGGLVGELFCGQLSVQNCFSNSTINANRKNMILGGKDNNYTPTYKITNTYFANGGADSFGGSSTNTDNFKSQNWFVSTLGWDFENVWTFDASNGYEYPVLQGFSGIGGGDHTHEYIEVERVEPTCVAEGYIRYTCNVCGGSYEEKIPSPTHEYITEFVEPTCTTDGYNRIIPRWGIQAAVWIFFSASDRA